jgi:hypothetical protein
MKSEADSFLGASMPSAVYPSMIRIYVAPTLTAQIGVAICLSFDKIFKKIPSPLSDLGGNCIIMTIKPQCKKETPQAELNSPNETFLPRTKDLTQNCTQERKGEAARQAGYASTPFNTIFGKMELENAVYPTSRKDFSKHPEEYTWSIGSPDTTYSNTMPDTNIMGMISVEGAPQSTLTIGNARIAPGDLTPNQVRGGIQQGLRKVIIDDRLDRQIRYIAAHFTKMHVSIKLPDLNDLLQEAETLGNLTKAVAVGSGEEVSGVAGFATESWEHLKNIKNINMNTLRGTINNYDQWSQEVNEVNDNLANPFEQLSLLFNQSKLINISTKNLTIKIPMIFQEDINSYEIYLRQRADVNSKIVQEWLNKIALAKDLCIKDFEKYESVQEALAKGTMKEDCPLDIQNVSKFSQQFELLLDQVNQNIMILNDYRNFPFELYERIHAIDRYVAEISAIVNNFLGYISYRMTANANRYSSYVDAIILIMNIIKTYQALIDFSINRGKKCNTCTTDTYDQYSCKLSLLCPKGLLPILQIPPFKIPNITLDLSNINVGLDILLPSFNFQPAKIELPTLPNLPSPPIGNISIRFPDLPTIPELPAPPRLPELPSFIPNINLELPILPPAPKLPEIPSEFEKALNIAEKI